MHPRQASLSCRLTVALILLSLSAAAEAGQSCEEDPECARLALQARELSKEGKHDDALRAYEQAYQQRSDPKLLYNLARVLHKAGQPAAAVAYYQKYLDAGAEGNAEWRHKAEQYLAQARQEVSAAAPPLPAAPVEAVVSREAPRPDPAPVPLAIIHTQRSAPKLSPRRKLIASVLGGLGGAVLISSIALTATDKQYTSLPCASGNAMGMCRLDNLALYATGYALTGALAIGLGITLGLPPPAARTVEVQ